MTDLGHADLESHHISGFARAALEKGEDGRFSVPLISEVEPTLWVGGCIDGVRLPDDFDFVVSLYPWEKYTLGPKTTREEVRLYDAAEVPDPEVLYDLAATISDLRRQGKKVLVHCQAGLNRSNLIAGLSLVLDGMPPAEAIALLRRKRSHVSLCNQTFENWLLQQG